MQVSDAVKQAYIDNSIKKHLIIYFPELNYTVPMDQVYADSMRLNESLSDSQSIEFVGCIASKFQVSIRDFGVNVKGKKIYASIRTDDPEYPDDPQHLMDPIPLFCGIVDEVKMQSNHRIKEIIAYDELYTKGNKDVSSWYKHLPFGKNGMTLGDIRRSLLQTMGLSYTEKTLPNDSIKIKKQYNPSSLQALAVLKSICQINGVFGMISREHDNNYNGIFKFISVPDIVEIEGAFPGPTLYPPFYPGLEGSGSFIPSTEEAVSHYRSLNYQEYSVKPVEMVIVRQSSEDDGGSFGIGDNKYIIQGNMFTLKFKQKALDDIAMRIYTNVQGFSYVPYTINNDGFPWIECGQSTVDCVVYDFNNSTASTDVYEERHFHILNRNMSGIQNLKDEYSAQGDEYQREFVSDIGVNIDVIQRNIQKSLEEYVDNSIDEYNDYVEDNYYDKEYIDNLPIGEGWSVESVDQLPPSGQDQVLYLIQGEVVVD